MTIVRSGSACSEIATQSGGGRNPGIGPENERVGSASFRAFPLSGLPLVIWYAVDEIDAKAPILFLILWHDSRLSPSGYMP